MAFIIPDVKVDFAEVISGYTIPSDISTDLVYCQIYLRQYMGFHQRVIKWLEQDKLRETTGRKVLDDIESEIFEINREQRVIVNRLRSSLDEYYGCLRSENVDVNPEQGNMHVARILTRLLGKIDPFMKPVNVKIRCSESQLMLKYGLHAIDESPIPFIDENNEIKIKAEPIELIRASPPCGGPFFGNKQVSLLKPKSERLLQKKPHIQMCDYKEVTAVQPPILKAEKVIQNIETVPKPTTTLPTAPPRTIENSRLLLLRALNKAKEQNPLSGAKKLQSQQSLSVRPVPEPVDKNHEDASRRSVRSPSSSDDSLDLREASPGSSENENNENDNVANDQELFLKQFGLYTKEQSLLLSQRRSKRRRRNIQSNEKSDFHYGNLDLSENGKRKKSLLLNTGTKNLKKRNIDSKPIATTSKVASLAIDRSSSSSPEQRPTCNECLKTGEAEDTQFPCVTCSGSFHMKCHTLALQKYSIKLREKHCPACFRTRCAEAQTQLRELQQRNILQLKNNNLKIMQRSLWKRFKRCEYKLMTANQRKDKLLIRGQKIKSEMNNFLKIVEDLKNM